MAEGEGQGEQKRAAVELAEVGLQVAAVHFDVKTSWVSLRQTSQEGNATVSFQPLAQMKASTET